MPDFYDPALEDEARVQVAARKLSKRGDERAMSLGTPRITKVTPPYENRRLDWFLAWMSLYFGLWLAHPVTSMLTDTTSVLVRWFPEYWWAASAIVAAVTHIIALIINGSQWWWTALTRAAVNIAGFLVWFIISLGVQKAYSPSMGIPIFQAIAFGHAFCAAAAVYDFRMMQLWRRQGRA